MSVEAWTWTIVILSFALYLGIGYWARVRETAGFYVAGRGVPPVANGGRHRRRLDVGGKLHLHGGPHQLPGL